MPLRKEDMLDWVDSLCSGEHVQTRDEFEYDGQQCCVAVLAEHAEESVLRKKRRQRWDEGPVAEEFSEIPFSEAAVFEALGLAYGQAITTSQYFIELNDEHELSYKQIADIILAGDFPNAPDMS